MIHTVLLQRYGPPSVVETPDFVEHRWNEHDRRKRCVLFVGDVDSGPAQSGLSPTVLDVYGQTLGGSLSAVVSRSPR